MYAAFVIMGRTTEKRKKMKGRPKKFVKGMDPDVKECLKLSDRVSWFRHLVNFPRNCVSRRFHLMSKLRAYNFI